ncbi:hypothetical protein ACFQ1S_13410 [Kibdelosporangium lantanae]|uniref:Uncharacterized protein n=1 Tax=Kibdelosporangium lantanae TaxID=1497396 RepID=A0ABW3MB00_9PSEU
MQPLQCGGVDGGDQGGARLSLWTGRFGADQSGYQRMLAVCRKYLQWGWSVEGVCRSTAR